MKSDFLSYQVIQDSDAFVGNWESCRTDQLPAGDVVVEVEYSSVNYKDSLSARGVRGVTRQYPHCPGIDAAGRVVESSDPEWQPGDEVMLF